METEAVIRSAAARDFLTESQVSEWLGVPKATLQVWRSTGRVALPYVKIGGHVRYRRRAVEEFTEQNTHGKGE